MNAIEIIALAVCYDIPIVMNADQVEHLSKEEHQFSLLKPLMQSVSQAKPAQQVNEALLIAILGIFDSKKKQIVYAAAELVGMILDSQSKKLKESGRGNAEFAHIWSCVKEKLYVNEVRERHDVFVFTVERISRQYPQQLNDRQLFLKTICFIKVLTGSMRAAVFRSFERYVEVARARKAQDEIDEIA